MKVTIEKVEKLVEHADVGYEDARAALEAANGDILEAVITLERDGKLGPNAGGRKAAYSTSGGVPSVVVGQSYGENVSSGARVEPNFTFGGGTQSGGFESSGGASANGREPHRYADESTAFEDGARRFFAWLGRVLRASIVNCFEIWRRGERVAYFPVVLFLFCLIPWVFWVTLVVLIIGLFCGWRYRFSGPHLGRNSLNETMDKMADTAAEAKRDTQTDEPRGTNNA